VTERERLLAAVELLPDGASVTLSRDVLLEALRGPTPTPTLPAPSLNGDRLLTPQEAADRLGVEKRWLYEHADDLPFRRKLGGHVRYSERGLNQYMEVQP
jgi:excisionase family DNA binding protein